MWLPFDLAETPKPSSFIILSLKNTNKWNLHQKKTKTRIPLNMKKSKNINPIYTECASTNPTSWYLNIQQGLVLTGIHLILIIRLLSNQLEWKTMMKEYAFKEPNLVRHVKLMTSKVLYLAASAHGSGLCESISTPWRLSSSWICLSIVGSASPSRPKPRTSTW
jgi:hypothetical protein